MEKSSRVFADTNFFVALFREADALHIASTEIAQNLEEQGVHLTISNLIFSEVVTVLSQRESKKVAIEAGLYLRNSDIETVYIDEVIGRDAWEIFQSVRQKNTSFVDCSTVAVIKAEGIPTLLSFDTTDFLPLQRRHRFVLYPGTSS